MSAATPTPTSASAPLKLVAVRQMMGMPISLHAHTPNAERHSSVFQQAAEAVFAFLDTVDQTFSTYKATSQVSRLRNGTLSLAEADDAVHQLAELCERAHHDTNGLFDANWQGWFDPTGLVKGWAIEEAMRRYLEPLCLEEAITAIGANAGGDMQLFTHPDASWVWNVGIADPLDSARTIATVPIVTGAVATSGITERGQHITDPRTGQAATSVLSATVVADSLGQADLWATTAIIAGADDLSWIQTAATRTGLIVTADNRVRRWQDSVEVDAVPATIDGLILPAGSAS